MLLVCYVRGYLWEAFKCLESKVMLPVLGYWGKTALTQLVSWTFLLDVVEFSFPASMIHSVLSPLLYACMLYCEIIGSNLSG